MQVSTAEFKKGLKIQFDGAALHHRRLPARQARQGRRLRAHQAQAHAARAGSSTTRSAPARRSSWSTSRRSTCSTSTRTTATTSWTLETYDQISLSAEEVGDARDFLKENTEVEILFIDGSPVTVELPNFIELAIAKTDPGIRGDTASGGSKPATLETGAVVQVPLFLNEGDVVKVDTRSGEYLGRVAAAG